MRGSMRNRNPTGDSNTLPQPQCTLWSATHNRLPSMMVLLPPQYSKPAVQLLLQSRLRLNQPFADQNQHVGQSVKLTLQLLAQHAGQPDELDLAAPIGIWPVRI